MYTRILNSGDQVYDHSCRIVVIKPYSMKHIIDQWLHFGYTTLEVVGNIVIASNLNNPIKLLGEETESN